MAGSRIDVRLRPRGPRDELIGMRDGVLQARVTAPPVNGKANTALCRLIAKRLGIAPSKVVVAQGEKSRNKVVRVEGVSTAALKRAFRDPEGGYDRG
ncbi:MAG TPA: DUF167 domain-containing protein [Solirubrobacterales bacterium]|nr:DUF167 domain-containing protein [Solirubrobacterales bacterium]